MSDPRRDFRRSSRFGLIGVGVVAVLAAALALLFGQGDANPTGVMIAILGLIFGFVAVLMYLQRRDLEAAASRSKLEAVAATEPVVAPTVADQPSLLADLATGPIDGQAIAAASDRMWDIGRRSIGSGAKMMVLIFCAVVPWQLFQFKWSLIVFVPLIVIYAAYLGARVIMPGGTLDQAYDDSGPALAALGLSEAEGASVYTGTRHGRAVSVRITGGSTVTVGGPVPEFEVRPQGERLRAAVGAPGEVEAVIAPLRASSYWKGVRFSGGPDGVVAERSSHGGERWMRDLWLAERLADAAGRR